MADTGIGPNVPGEDGPREDAPRGDGPREDRSREDGGARRFPRRWPLFRALDRLIAALPAPKRRAGALVVRTFGIGDALLFRAVMERYAEALNLPPAQITILGSTAWAAVAPLFFAGRKLELIDERRFARDLFYRLRWLWRIRRQGYESVICGMEYRQPHVVDSLIVASAARHRIVLRPRGHAKYDAMFAHYLPRMTRIVTLPQMREHPEHAPPLGAMPLRRHEILQQIAFLSELAGRPLPAILPVLTAPAGLPPLPELRPPYAILNLGASHSFRRWPLARHLDLARRLLAARCSVVLLGGPAERALAGEAAAALASLPTAEGGAQAMLAIDRLDFAAAARLVAGAAVVISSDTGIGHLAIMLRRPAVIVAGGGHFGSFVPYPAELTPPGTRFVYHAMPCYHCDWDCTMKQPGDPTFPCIANVAPERVWQAVQELDCLPTVA